MNLVDKNKNNKTLNYNIIKGEFNEEKYNFQTSYKILKYHGALHMQWRIQPTPKSWTNIWNIHGVVTLTAYQQEENMVQKKKILHLQMGIKIKKLMNFYLKNLLKTDLILKLVYK